MLNSKAVSSVRLIALCMIVSCHIFQGEDMILAWWFNVGVQIFLFMSGFLYGIKDISSVPIWIKKRLAKILVPYYLLLGIVVLFYLFFARNLFTINSTLTNILLLQGFGTGLAGIEHLWFISYILLCYLITPILQSLDLSSLRNTRGKYTTKLFLLLVALQILNIAKVINLSVPNIGAYITGYYFSRRHFYYENYHKLSTNVSLKKSVAGVFAACILTTPLVVYLEYFNNGKLFSILIPYEYLIFAWNHTLLGATLFLVMYFLFDYLYSRKTCRVFVSITKWSDTYSYHVYLTHQIFILGQFSLLGITPVKLINIIVIILCAVITGMALQKINSFVINKLRFTQREENSLKA